MSAIKATWKNRQIVPDEEVNWPEGCRLLVEPVTEEETLGIREEDWSNTPEAITDWLKWYDSLQPLLLTPAEEADAEAWMRKMNDYSLAKLDQGAEDIFQ